MPFVGLVIAMMMLFNFKRHWRSGRWDERLGREWERERTRRRERTLEREQRRGRRQSHRHAWGCGAPTGGFPTCDEDAATPPGETTTPRDKDGRASRAPGGERAPSAEDDARRRARRRATAEAAFVGHVTTYLSIIALLAFINLVTGGGPWFLWPAFGWGIGVFSHFMSLFGSRMVRERFFEPALERELRRERVVMQTEKQASIDELSSTIAHEIRNPIAAAKSLVQQMGEDPQSVENVEYAKVALEELDRVERRISHLLKFAKEEDYAMALVNLAAVVDSALTQMRAKLDTAKVAVTRNYIAGPTIAADAEKLRQVFVNIVDNAIDALGGIPENRRLELFIENGGGTASARLRDNGCGIPSEQLDRIFNPFFSTKDTGTGLGMAISKKIVEAHGGTIEAVSTVGRGTEFVITLPLPGPAA
jgi:signal transduction histidine kinase